MAFQFPGYKNMPKEFRGPVPRVEEFLKVYKNEDNRNLKERYRNPILADNKSPSQGQQKSNDHDQCYPLNVSSTYQRK